jgi:ferric-dicitrate binding protein FerR (iron transport regulator)
LWCDGKGRFRSDGRYGSAGVRGTIWLTEDRCDGTLVRVRRGRVDVDDIPRRRTVTLSAGQSYLARAP